MYKYLTIESIIPKNSPKKGCHSKCSKTLKIKDVKETITGDFKMCEKHLEMIEKKYNKT